MFRHLFTLMWNKRRSNSMIFLEIFLAFVVLFGVYAFISYNLERYRSPLGFNYEDTIGIRLDFPDDLDSLVVLETQEQIRRDLLEMPEVEELTFIGDVNPFGGSTWQTNNTTDGFTMYTQMMFVDEHFDETMEVDMIDGRWFNDEDNKAKYPPMVVNKEFKELFFPDVASIVDSVIQLSGYHVIVGVTDDFKYKSNFSENYPLSFYPQVDRLEEGDPFEMLILRMVPGQKSAAEEKIYNLLVSYTKNTDVVIWDMALDRIKANRPITIPMTILIVIACFLLINIALGLFGVLFTQISRRRAEIGLRKAMGASSGWVTTQFVLEVLIVAGAALVLGVFFAVQVPLLDLTPVPDRFFYWGIAGAILTILVIVTICAIIPSRQAAGLHPANVLHED